jgi:hypothetical protein
LLLFQILRNQNKLIIIHKLSAKLIIILFFSFKCNYSKLNRSTARKTMKNKTMLAIVLAPTTKFKIKVIKIGINIIFNLFIFSIILLPVLG